QKAFRPIDHHIPLPCFRQRRPWRASSSALGDPPSAVPRPSLPAGGFFFFDLISRNVTLLDLRNLGSVSPGIFLQRPELPLFDSLEDNPAMPCEFGEAHRKRVAKIIDIAPICIM
ncbi:unnamed protein product, partial [Musa hybrid cultivar]